MAARDPNASVPCRDTHDTNSAGKGLMRRAAVAGACAAVLLIGVWRLDVLPQRGTGATAHGTAAAEARPTVPAVPATVRWLPERVIEGTLLTFIVEGGEPAVLVATGTFAGEPLHFRADDDGVLTALAAAPLDSAGVLALRPELTHADGSRDDRRSDVAVEPGEYRMERLSVAPQFGQPQPAAIQQRMREEAARARAVSARSHETPRMWEPPFVAPRESRITSGFGHGRMFNDQVQSRHTGTDFAGAVGTPVRAPARGIVGLVDDFYLGGGVIYIDHGAGLVTGYLHLSGKDVVEGDIVEAGQVIGRVGATGRVTGPHLHWIVRYGAHTVDGMSLLAYR
jgi:murein DD-endopeptidase MepM/ murein hydrolase activator NlpD